MDTSRCEHVHKYVTAIKQVRMKCFVVQCLRTRKGEKMSKPAFARLVGCRCGTWQVPVASRRESSFGMSSLAPAIKTLALLYCCRGPTSNCMLREFAG